MDNQEQPEGLQCGPYLLTGPQGQLLRRHRPLPLSAAHVVRLLAEQIIKSDNPTRSRVHFAAGPCHVLLCHVLRLDPFLGRQTARQGPVGPFRHATLNQTLPGQRRTA